MFCVDRQFHVTPMQAGVKGFALPQVPPAHVWRFAPVGRQASRK
jgi:hypothetical protein